MERSTWRGLNPLQIAGLIAVTIVGSSTIAVGVLVAVRRRAAGGQGSAGAATAQPSVGTVMPARTPDHFSEDLVIPGATFTGTEIEEQDDALGRSPEGV